MVRFFKKLIVELPVGRQEKIRQGTKKRMSGMALNELRRALSLTQVELASTLEMNQAAVSKMERQSDMYVSTLRRLLAAMGAELKIMASFPDQEIQITQFEGLLSEEEELEV